MALFVHLTPEKNIKAIIGAGIKPGYKRGTLPESVFAVPVTPNFYVSHQWLRELRRSGQRTICGVYFRIPDEETVHIGHYNENHRAVTATEATAIFMEAENREGYEVLVPRKVESGEIHRVRHLPQVVGWRYIPDAHNRPFCGCVVCVPPGTIRARQKNEAWEENQAKG